MIERRAFGSVFGRTRILSGRKEILYAYIYISTRYKLYKQMRKR
jgi:hypothetical protein